MGKDWNALDEYLGKKSLRKQFDGELEAEEVDGKLLTDMLSMFSDKFECERFNKFLKLDEIFEIFSLTSF